MAILFKLCFFFLIQKSKENKNSENSKSDDDQSSIEDDRASRIKRESVKAYGETFSRRKVWLIFFIGFQAWNRSTNSFVFNYFLIQEPKEKKDSKNSKCGDGPSSRKDGEASQNKQKSVKAHNYIMSDDSIRHKTFLLHMNIFSLSLHLRSRMNIEFRYYIFIVFRHLTTLH